MAVADYYRFYVDWRKDGLFDVSDFEDGTVQGWEPQGSFPPEIQAWSNPGTPSGDWELFVTWRAWNPFTFGVAGKGFDDGRFGTLNFENPANPFTFGTAGKGFDQGRFTFDEVADGIVEEPTITKVVNGFTPGLEYTLTALVYVGSSSSTYMNVTIGVDGIGASDPATTLNTYSELSYTFTATAAEHTLVIAPYDELSVDARITFLDRFRIIGPDVDITDRVRNLEVSIAAGRDTARNLEDVRPSSVSLTLKNLDGKFSPTNPGSPLYGFLKPGRELYIESKFDSIYYDLYRGYIDNMDLNAGFNATVPITSNDLLARMAEQTLSTPVYPALTTGEAVGKILDEIDWPADKRDIDQGSSTLRFWNEEGTDALTALKNVKEAEGLPCLYGVDGKGVFYFHDRQHRILNERSDEEQENFYSNDILSEPRFSPPFSYKLGFDDIVNSVTASVTERTLGPEEVVWETTETFIVPNLGEKVVIVEATTAFYAAVSPEEGVDYEAYDSGTATVTLNRTSGRTLELKIKATGGPVTVVGMRVRANPVVETQYQVKVEDTASIDDVGKRDGQLNMTFANREDAAAVATVYLGHRAQILPTISFAVNNDENAPDTTGAAQSRLKAIFESRLSDRIRLTDPNSYTDRAFFIESVTHSITETGKVHVTTFACEAASAQLENVFTFDDPDLGFDNGVFGIRGQLLRDQVFILDDSELDAKLLGY